MTPVLPSASENDGDLLFPHLTFDLLCPSDEMGLFLTKALVLVLHSKYILNVYVREYKTRGISCLFIDSLNLVLA